MNLTRIISIKERIATSPLFNVEERDFILEAINMAVEETMRSTGKAEVKAHQPIGGSPDVTASDLARLKELAGLQHMPTPFTYEYRVAMSGKGPHAYDWSDKPHRLVYDLCRAIEEAEGKS